MGLLIVGKPLTWEQAMAHLRYVRDHGVQQFLHTYRRLQHVANDDLLWGDEVEYHILTVDHAAKKVQISLTGAQKMEALSEKEEDSMHMVEGCHWHPEYGAWMIEGTPRRPYTGFASDLLRAERNMILRRRRLLSVLGPNEIAPTVTAFPMLGVGQFFSPEGPLDAPASQSNFIPDVCINPHPRFAALTRSIRRRRGSKVDIRVPLFNDRMTPEFAAQNDEKKQNNEEGYVWQLNEDSSPSASDGHSEQDVPRTVFGEPMVPEPTQDIHMDCMAFGMGSCCLQVTFQARDVAESRYLYDQLAVMAPIVLALTAATPIQKGRLANTDVRWHTIASSVDDRTPIEKGEATPEEMPHLVHENMAGGGTRRVYKSRYDSISSYIYHCPEHTLCTMSFEKYNDVPCAIDETYKQVLLDNGIDHNLAHHIAHLFVRDPLVIFEDGIVMDDEENTNHWENIQSTNWQTVRWKPPPIVPQGGDHVGWRTEFRSMEVQITDFENAAFSVFTVLLSRVILSFDLVLYLPLSKVDENLHRAHAKDAVQTQKFYFRKFIATPDTTNPCEAKALQDGSSDSAACGFEGCDAFEEMTLGEIFNGNGSYFPGLIPLIRAYLEYIQCDKFTFRRVNEYLNFISRRANGDLLTPAQWMRKFVRNHPSYRFDSIITDDIAYDLMMACKHIGEGKLACPDLLGDIVIDPVDPEDAYDRHLVGHLDRAERQKLIRRYFKERKPSVSSGASAGEAVRAGRLETKRTPVEENGVA